MACKDKTKVWVQVKAHQRQVLKCMDKKTPKTKHYNIIDLGTGHKHILGGGKKRKKITKKLNIADFAIPGYRRAAKKKKPRKAKIALTPPPRKPHKKYSVWSLLFGGCCRGHCAFGNI